MKHIKLYEAFREDQLQEGVEKVTLSAYTKFLNVGNSSNIDILFSASEKERIESLANILGKTIEDQNLTGKMILSKPGTRTSGDVIFSADAILRKNLASENEFHYGLATSDPQARYLSTTLDGLIVLVMDLFNAGIEWTEIK